MHNMTSKEINMRALGLLASQDLITSQKLFFENARRNPSYQTYNNLGFFLLTEGLTDKNGRTRNAEKLATKYLLKSLDIKETATNHCAIATLMNFMIRALRSINDECSLYRKMALHLERATKLSSDFDIQYNLLRSKFALDYDIDTLLPEIRAIVSKKHCEETVILYLEALIKGAYYEEGLMCIEKYKQHLDDWDLFEFYTRTKMYQKALELCEPIIERFSVEYFEASAIIECCVNTGNFEKARLYAGMIWEREAGYDYVREDDKMSIILDNLDESSSFRREILNEAHRMPPFMDMCCYFGCDKHGVSW